MCDHAARWYADYAAQWRWVRVGFEFVRALPWRLVGGVWVWVAAISFEGYGQNDVAWEVTMM